MEISHFHIEFQNLEESVEWMQRVLGKAPAFQNAQMAIYKFGSLGINFDKGEKDSKITLAMKSVDCDFDFSLLAAKGVQVLESPNSKPYGVRSAYVKGPGQVIFEVDQLLEKGAVTS